MHKNVEIVLMLASYAVQGLVLLACLHLFLPLVVFWTFRRKIREMLAPPAASGATPPTTEFVLLIPAHNEAELLPALLTSIKAQHYPAQLITPVVIADNCQDATAAIARKAQVLCLERFSAPPSNKMQALLFATETFLAQGLSGQRVVCIIDADCYLDPYFLVELNQSYTRPNAAQAMQCYRYVSNTFTSDVTVLDAAAEALRQCVLSGTRKLMEMDNFIYGLGFTAREQVFRELMALPTYSLAEDKDWKAHLVERGVKVDYCPKAQLSYVVVTDSVAFQKQRSRWLAGHFESMKKHGFQLLGLGLLRANLSQLDFACELLQPPRSLLLLCTVIFGVLSVWAKQYALVTCWVWWGLALTFCLYGLLGLRLVNAKREQYLLIFSGAVLILNVIKSAVAVLLGKGVQTWSATRTSSKQGVAVK
ncbi:glycosyltransferase family 2 protein [Hymenobacter fodinae]|uniref:Glycosyltransferase n=1 Tax=Hymenobacter fodinae TaxID=2510796 RepID=A0A4Z0P280_9BACT|nr:glycosyltransferase family 2 protein [Hymenobacter fodinae]TGE04184.1 glycosyltransferase [Hymenobacter fodinae]